MGARGPAPLPTVLQILHGNPGKRPLNENEPKPEIPLSVPPAPRHLSKEAKKEWKHQAAILHRLRLLSELDLNLLAMHCEAWAIRKAAIADVETRGINVKTEDGFRRNPSLLTINETNATLLKIAAQLGMTPAARSRLAVSGPNAKDNPFDDLLAE